MSSLFLRLLNISITASWIVLIVVLLRFVLKKAPKWIRVALWGLVAVRLIVPVSVESALSLVPSAETVQIEPISVSQTVESAQPSVPVQGERIVLHSGFSVLNRAINPSETEAVRHVDTVAVLKTVAGWVWLAGVIGMLLYALLSYLRIRRRVRASIKLEMGVYACDDISDPFILGLFRPNIYLPSGMDESTKAYVLAHERAHLNRLDHIWKPLGFLLLSVYWFNPFIWLAYILLCRDIELACDEKVAKTLDDDGKAAYSSALLKCSVSRRTVAACPLAFGEIGVKQRVKSILNYKKPAFWIILVAIVLGIAVGVCFLTVPKKDKTSEADPEPTSKPDVIETTLPDFPGVTFRQTFGSVEAEENGRTRTLFAGMPVETVFFEDVTGDQKPDLCATIWFGSGMVDSHIVVYDYVSKQSYVLWARGMYDYHLYTVDGVLYVGKTPYMGDKQIDCGPLKAYGGVPGYWAEAGDAFTSFTRQLHESDLYGEWLVQEETDNKGNVLYTTSVELFKEYDFKGDGTVVYNETVPISSQSELAFGHPTVYPCEVHDDNVFIDGDSTDGFFRWGTLDPDGSLTLMYNTSDGTVYAKLRRAWDIFYPAPEDGMLHEATLHTTWMLAEIEAPDGSDGDARGLGLKQYLVFRPDGTVRIVDETEAADRIVPYTVNGNTVRFEDRVLRYDAEWNELVEIEPTTQVILYYAPAPDAVLP